MGQHQSKKQRDQESSNKVTSDLSENSDFIMPELEPQVTNISKNLIEKQMDTPKSHQKYKSRKEEIKNQKSIKDFFRKNVNDNLSSDSSQQEEAAEKKEQKKEKVQKQ